MSACSIYDVVCTFHTNFIRMSCNSTNCDIRPSIDLFYEMKSDICERMNRFLPLFKALLIFSAADLTNSSKGICILLVRRTSSYVGTSQSLLFSVFNPSRIYYYVGYIKTIFAWQKPQRERLLKEGLP